MFPIYEEKTWKALLACVDGDTLYSAASTYCYYDPKAGSVSAFGSAQGTDSEAGYFIFAAHEPRKRKLHLMYSYESTA
jgi:hypothetical protein